MLIPGLAEIDSQEVPKTFVAFLSGRMSHDAARIKQVQLGIAAFATAQREARDEGRPENLRKQTKLLLRGVDFDDRLADSSLKPTHDPETELREFAETYAQAVINLHALPFTEDRAQLYSELSRASVALMPSWHEGFGLAAWEAIAAGVPLILSKSSGVYSLLDEVYAGAATGCIYPIEVDGATAEPLFSQNDLKSTVKALKAVADDPRKARMQAGILRNMLLERYTWPACAEQAMKAFEWHLAKGSVPALTPENLSHIPSSIAPITAPVNEEHEPLRIPAGQWRVDAGMADSQLLRAEEALLEFDSGRQSEVDKLNEWIGDSTWPFSVRLITGTGGQGKTRLALEVCHQRRVAGWHAGLLDNNLEANGMTAAWRTLHERRQPIFVVVDYAETRQAVLLALLRAALQKPSKYPIRVLLLARDGGEWWDNLPSKDPQCEALLSGYATTGPFRLSPLYTSEKDRREAFRRALSAFAQTLGVTAPTIDPDLSGEHFERPLFVQMAALLALYGEQPTTAQGLTRALLNHERRYWIGLLAHFNWPEPERRAEQLLTLTTLCGGFATPKAAESYWLKAKGRVVSTAEFNSLFRELAALYPGSQGLQALRPDLLGEALVAQALLRAQGDALLDAVLTSSATHLIRRNALTVLARLSTQRLDLQEMFVEVIARHFTHCCQDIVTVSQETTSQLPVLAELAFSRLTSAIKSQAAGLLAPLFREESVQLGTLSCLIAEYLAMKSREKFDKKRGNPDRISDYARALFIHAVHLSRIGRYSQACEKDREALELYRRLPVADFHRIEPDYAALLSNFSNNLSEVGYYKEVFPFAEEGLKIHKRLAEKNPERFEHDLARALNNYANHLVEAGQNADALEHSRQALEIRRRLAEKNPERFEPDLASSLDNYANRLSDAGQYKDALEHARQALEIHKRLAEKNRDRFEPYLASSLNNYANRLSDAGENEDALKHARQALEIYKRLAEKNPERFEPYLASSLNNYANRLSDAGQEVDALEHARQALEIRKRLAEKNRDRFEPYLASSLNNYASHLAEAGQNLDALKHARQALEIYKRVAEKNPERFEPDLASSLNNYANRLSDAGQNVDALEHARQALEIYKRMAEKRPGRFSEDVFSSICSMRFLTWLEGQEGDGELQNLDQTLALIPAHEQRLMLLFSAFVEACWATETTLQGDAFRKAVSAWTDLSAKSKNRAKPYWLCAAAWCATFSRDAVVSTDWEAQWRQYAKQREGRIPKWMLLVAQHLKFEWPK